MKAEAKSLIDLLAIGFRGDATDRETAERALVAAYNRGISDAATRADALGAQATATLILKLRKEEP